MEITVRIRSFPEQSIVLASSTCDTMTTFDEFEDGRKHDFFVVICNVVIRTFEFRIFSKNSNFQNTEETHEKRNTIKKF